jgi:beta-galactosidase
MMDVCGFPKDNVYYLKSWWSKEPVLHILPHWNWSGLEGREIDVWAYSNCDEVELFLNKKSLGKKKMDQYGHLEWKVAYKAGTLEAIGYKNGKKILTDIRRTTGKAEKIKLSAHKTLLTKVNGVAIATVAVTDKNGMHVPIADNEITFEVKGGGKIIGVGNGNPTSLEKDKFIDAIDLVPIDEFEEQPLNTAELPQQLPVYNDSKWNKAFKDRDYKNLSPTYVYRGTFNLENKAPNAIINFYYQKIGVEAVVFVNGIRIMPDAVDMQKYNIAASIIKNGTNTIHIVATPLRKVKDWDVINTNPGAIQVIAPSAPWKRKLFNGLAQVIIQADGSGKDIIFSAKGEGVKPAIMKISVK